MDKKIILVIFLIALLVRIASLYDTPVRWWDETVYASLGWNLASNPLDYSFKKFGDYIPDTWQQAGMRAPLLPYITAAVYALLGEKQLLVNIIVPITGAAGAVALFFMAKSMFNSRVALYSAVFLAFLPLHVYYSGKIMTDILVTTLMTLSVLFFWLGFEKKKKGFKILTGIASAFSILARYTAIWLPAIFFAYLLIRDRNLKFLRDKELWHSAAIFFLVLAPWLLYSYSEYGTPLGALLHGSRSINYWGGSQPWYYLFYYFPQMFSAAAPLLVLGIIFFAKGLRNFNMKGAGNRALLLNLLWFFSILLFTSFLLPHKEDRFLLPLAPPLAIVSALAIDRLKKYKKHAFAAASLIILASSSLQIYDTAKVSYTPQAECFLKAADFLKTTSRSSLILSDSSPIIYHYSHRETSFLPESFNSLEPILEKKDRDVYFLWSAYENGRDFPENTDYTVAFKCPDDGSLAKIYKY